VLKTGIDSITETYNELLILPNTAAIMTTFDARFFSSIPQRSYDTRLLKVKVPLNYNPYSKTYDGIWNGAFKLAWTDNPAWCFYDLLTNRRYGLGKYVDPRYTDKWTLYEIGKYCDQLVSDGKGGLEPRFTCNMLISTREDAYKVVNDMASIFRGLVYYSAGLIMISQDRPKDAIYIFNNSNVKDGEFTYSNTSRRVRRNIALVRYNDKDNFFKPAVKYVENREGIIRYGIRETEVSAFGCTSEGQAERLGKWTLISENSESELVSFETSLPAMYLKPGDIVLIQDQNRQNKILGGRTYELNKNYAILDVKYENISGYLPVISGCKFNILTPAGNIEIGTPSGNYLTDLQEQQQANVFKERVLNDIEFMTTEGMQSGINTSVIRRKQIQTINYNIENDDTSSNSFGAYVSLETGINYNGYTKLSFGSARLDDKEHTLLQNTVWTIELDPKKYDHTKSPSISGKSSASLYPGASLEPYIDRTQKFRVLDIEEQEEYRYKITALQYEESKYDMGDDI
jgi:predicted phage tail protein